MRESLRREIKDLCDLIVNSPPDTPIRGEIGSRAFELGHAPEILNAPLDEMKPSVRISKTVFLNEVIFDAIDKLMKELAQGEQNER